MNDTIVAISTALGEGAISIIRVSGEDAISIVNPLFKEKDLDKVKSHTINYGHIVYKGEIIDEAIVRNRFYAKYPERKDRRDMLTFIGIYYETITQGLLENGKLRRIAGGFVVQNLEKNNQEQELTK